MSQALKGIRVIDMTRSFDSPDGEVPVTKFIAVRSASRAFGRYLVAPLTAVDLGIVDLAGDPSGVRAALGWLQAEPFKQRDAWLVVSDGRGTARIGSLTTVAAPTQESAA